MQRGRHLRAQLSLQVQQTEEAGEQQQRPPSDQVSRGALQGPRTNHWPPTLQLMTAWHSGSRIIQSVRVMPGYLFNVL